MSASNVLPEIPGGWTRAEFPIGDRQFQLTLPALPDAFLDDPDVQRANQQNDYMPYWAYLWPASTTMARLILEHPWTVGTRTLEIGSGVGLVGIAGLAAGLDLTFSDYDATSVESALRNARVNGFDQARGWHFDWRDLTKDVAPFELIIGCEVVYEAGNHPLVLNVLDRYLARDGVCWIGDPGRVHAPGFCRLAIDRGYSIDLLDATGTQVPLKNDQLDLEHGQFRMLILRKR